ncbi:amino acid ABC transporter [Shewanella colwelliana]|nr:amino acid ABC transporter [Shewanella colwelliana]
MNSGKELLIKLILALLTTMQLSSSVYGCEITMGYRTSERQPYIQAAPNNEGLYQALYSAAAQRIGCKLSIVRQPKHRILRQIMLGTVDFYPGLGFNTERDTFAQFIPNGLTERYIGISHRFQPQISSLDELVGSEAILLISPGGYEVTGIPDGVLLRKPADMDVEQALDLLSARKGDFFTYDEATLRYILDHGRHSDLTLHPQCCEAEHDMYMGFSRKSQHFAQQANLNYDAKRPVSAMNSQFAPHKDSIAYAMSMALTAMKLSGETEQLRAKYFDN